MIYLDEITQGWEHTGDWRIAPDNCSFMAKGYHLIVCGVRVTIGDKVILGYGVKLGNDVVLGYGVMLGDDVMLGNEARDINNLRYADKYPVYP